MVTPWDFIHRVKSYNHHKKCQLFTLGVKPGLKIILCSIYYKIPSSFFTPSLIVFNFMLVSSFVRLERVQNERDDLHQQLKIVTDETLTAEEKAQRMDMLLKEEEARIYDVEKQLSRLRETQVGIVFLSVNSFSLQSHQHQFSSNNIKT